MRSNSTSNVRVPYGMVVVVSPRELTYSGTCHQWFCFGERASLVLPTTCIHMCSVSCVACHSARGRRGQVSSSTSRTSWLDATMSPSNIEDHERMIIMPHPVDDETRRQVSTASSEPDADEDGNRGYVPA